MKIKSLLSILMVSIMILCCFSGCGKNDVSSNPSSKDKEDMNKENSYTDVITIAKTESYEEDDPWNRDGEYGDAMQEVLNEIENELKIKINIDYYSPTEFTKLAQSAITNGDTEFADIMEHNLFSFGPLYAQGLLYDLSTIDGLDISADFWEDAITNLSTFKDGTYGIGSSGINGYGTFAGVKYNRDMVKSLGLEDPMELARRGEWTWAKFREYCLKAAKDLNNDGRFSDEDRFGCTSVSYDAIVPVWLNAGVPTIKKDESGNLVYNMLSNEAVALLQKFHSTFTVDDGMFYAANMDGIKQQEHFLSGNAMFLFGSWTKESEDSGAFEIAVAPSPTHTADAERLHSIYHNGKIMTVPAITEKAELIGKFLQLLGEKTKDFTKYSIADSAVTYTDRDQYLECVEEYSASFNVDYLTIMLNSNEAISIGTMRAIAMPIFSGDPYSSYTEGNARKIQSLLDEMFNQK